MKKIINIASSFIFLTIFLIYIASCSSSEPKSKFSNIDYDSDTETLTFDLTITDSKSLGSDYKVHLKETSAEDCTYQEITNLESTTYTFDSVKVNTNYTLYVTCTYKDTENYEIRMTKTFNTTGTDYLTELGITYEDTTVSYNGESQQIYATYDSDGVDTKIEENKTYTSGNYSYQFSYSNTYNQINVGTYTQTLTIFRLSANGFINVYRTEVATISKTLTIEKAKDLYMWEDLTVEYTGDEISMPVTDQNLTYTYFDSNNNQVSTIINPGTYSVHFEFSGNDNYEASSGYFNITVNKKTITSTLTNQTVELIDGKASIDISDDSFNMSNLEYSVTYKELDGTLIDTPYVTNEGQYLVEISVSETEYTSQFNVSIVLTVSKAEIISPILVSNVEYFKTQNQSYGFVRNITYYAYINLYNTTNASIDLSNVYLYFNNKKTSISGTIESKGSYVILLYSGNLSDSRYNFEAYADYYEKVSFDSISTIATLYSDEHITYTINSTYKNYNSYLSDRTNYTFTYEEVTDLSTALNNVSNFTYTTSAPTLNYSFDFTTISLSRINDLYDVLATDGLGNPITITSDMIDTSNVTINNIGQSVNVYFNIKDNYGNVASFIKTFVVVDEEGPTIELSNDVLEGSLTMHVSSGTSVDLTKYFVAYDDVDGDITVTSDMISADDLNLDVLGKYNITVSATDSSNNTTTFSITLYVDCGYLSDLTSETIKSSLTGEKNAMPSTGNVSVLVIPVFFNTSNETTAYLDTLETVFNSTNSDLAIGSVKSYYQISSYNKLNLSFDIYRTSYITLPQSKKYYDSNIANLLNYALDKVDGSVDFSKYDSDNDGTIDAIWFVYDIDYDSSTNYFWAWTSDMSSYLSSRDGMNIGKICFASYEFTNSSDSYYSSYTDSDYSTLTARTYIHETGHLFGLYDYYDYDYDYTVGVHHTMYGCSMMDSNFGDLDAGSKILLGWIDPIVVSETEALTIRSTALYGDAIVIAKESRINNTIFSEYIILEFWTSDGLNKVDSDSTFGLNNYGIRVLHMDASINYNSSGVPTQTTGSRPSYFKYNNTDNDDYNFLETLALNSGSVYSPRTKKYNTINNVLFNTSDVVFGKDKYSTFTYHDNTSLDFTFNILNISSEEVSVLITYK